MRDSEHRFGWAESNHHTKRNTIINGNASFMPEGYVVLLLVDLDPVIEEPQWLVFKSCRVKHNESNMFEGTKKYLFKKPIEMKIIQFYQIDIKKVISMIRSSGFLIVLQQVPSVKSSKSLQ